MSSWMARECVLQGVDCVDACVGYDRAIYIIVCGAPSLNSCGLRNRKYVAVVAKL